MHCVFCGNQNADGSAVCQNCGRTLPPQQNSSGWGDAPSYPPPTTMPTDPVGGATTNSGWGQPSAPDQWTPASYPPPTSPGAGSTSFGSESSSSFGNPAPPSFGAPAPPPSFGAAPYSPYQPGGFGGAPGSWTPPPSFGMMSASAASAKKQAIWALVCSIVGVLCCGIILGPIGIGLGYSSRSTLQREGVEDGQSFATAAMIIGGIDVVLFVIYMLFNLSTGLGRGF